ncbi:MAG: nucleotide exchange factor GrpE [Lachnospiraceae bacterium]|nr:nucleotide exchange factor GrpE [Lachnospiraceae bacterium]
MGKKDKKNSREETIEKLKGLKEAVEKEKEAEKKKEEEAKAASGDNKEESAAAEGGKEAEEKAAPEEKAEESAAAEDLSGAGDKAKAKIDELNDKVMRQMAEFENYRKRTEKEKQSMFEVGAKSVIEKLLPVVDNFERGLATLSEEEAQGGFAKGIEMVYKQLMEELSKLEVKPIEAVGKEFDPNLHNAVMHVEDEEAGENIIVEEFQKGYTYRDAVVRHSMVKVAN